ncbi:hypothetical protein Alsa1_CDS0158 [Staphylococcus phage Alsa_1]|nr:hypothetical protein Alsa1_CDS0158 [Staphylococcus phage Alsa_1]
MFVYQARHTLKGQFENEFMFRENAVYRDKETLIDNLLEQGYHKNKRGNGDTEYIRYHNHDMEISNVNTLIKDIVVIDTVELV